MPAIDSGYILRHKRIDEIRSKPLEPLDYCQKWVPKYYGKQPGDWGYKAACIRELMRVTQKSQKAIEAWGAEFSGRPEDVLVILRQADIINQVRELTALPPDFPEK